MEKILSQILRYRHLILVVSIVALVVADPLGYATSRAQHRATIRNQMMVERAETEKKIAIIQAETEAALARIAMGEEAEIDGCEGEEAEAHGYKDTGGEPGEAAVEP